MILKKPNGCNAESRSSIFIKVPVLEIIKEAVKTKGEGRYRKLSKTAFLEEVGERAEILSKIPGLQEVELQMLENISDSCEAVYRTCKDLIQSGGKRIRPILVLTACQCFSPLNQDAIQIAVACELIHLASLIHDDVIDQSDTRRNRPTVHTRLGNRISILMGDYLFAKSFEILSKNRLTDSMQFIVKAIAEMCDGEIFQDENRFNFNQTIEDYYKRIYQKTGVLMAACCQAGAVAGKASAAEVKALESYGRNVGYAYQIIDDILDFIGNEEILGKPTGCDLKEGHVTLPMLKLMENKKYKDWLQNLLNRKEDLSRYDGEIVKYLKESGAIEFSYREAAICVDRAKKALYGIKDSPYKQFMMDLADQILMRMH